MEVSRIMENTLWDSGVVELIMMPEDISFVNKSLAIKALADCRRADGLIQDTYLVAYHNDSVYFTNGTIVNQDRFMYHEVITDFERQYNKMPASYLPKLTLATYDDDIFLIRRFPTPEKNGLLIAKINKNKLFSFVKESETGVCAIYDSDGALLISGGDVDGSDINLEAPLTGWRFVIKEQPIPSFAGLKENLTLILLMLLVFAVLSILLSLYITYKIYRPIENLFKAVAQNSPIDGVDAQNFANAKNELDYILCSFENARALHNSLSQRLETAAPAIREKLYRLLLQGQTLPQKAIEDTLVGAYSCLKPSDSYSVIVISAISSKDASCGKMELDPIKMGIYGMLKTIKNHYRFDWCSMLDRKIVVLFPFSPEFSYIERKKLFDEFKSMLLSDAEKLDCNIIFGCGKIYDGIKNIYYSYDSALKDFNLKFLHHDDNQLASEGKDLSQQSHDVADTIILSAMDGNRIEASTILEKYVLKLVDDNGDEPLAEVLSAIIAQIAQQLVEFKVPKKQMAFLEEYFENSKADIDNAELARMTVRAGAMALALLSGYGQKNRNRYIRQLKKYIGKNYNNSDLSLSDVASFIGINPTYLSQLIGNSGNASFLDMLNSYRVENAQLLLRQTEFAIGEIGLKTGFNSVQNFNRVFKKYTGMTPGQYRKSHETSGRPSK